MAKIPNLVIEKIKLFLILLEKNNIIIKGAYIFGSYAKGNFDKWSDIDLAIISDDFMGDSFQDRLRLNDYIFESAYDISPMPYRSEDFEDSMFARDEIIKKGIQIV